MISAHQGSFIAGTVFFAIALLLYGIRDGYVDEKNVKKCMTIAINLFSLAGSIAWFIVHCLMLKIFATYGKPLEDDQKTLI